MHPHAFDRADTHAIVFDPADPLRTFAGNDGGAYHHTRLVSVDGSPTETTIACSTPTPDTWQ